MQRDEWVFLYTANKLADAAEKQRDFRKSRIEWWEGQKAAVMAEVKETGIEVNESLGSLTSNTSYGHAPQVMVRADLQTKLTECHRKILEHTNRHKEYEGWVQVLRANPETQLSLHHDDWLYFFGR
jgi:hypothetical protein